MVDDPATGLNELLDSVHRRLGGTVTSPDTLRDLLEAVLVVGAGLDLDTILQRIVRAATELLGARYGALGVRAPGGGLSEFVYEGIDSATRATMGHLPEGRGLLGLLVDDPRPVRIRELATHAASVGFPPDHPPMHSFLGMPIIVRGQAFGSIYLTEKRDGPEFTDEDQSILTVLAESAALAIDNARLFEQSLVRERWLTAMSSITSRLLVGGSVPETLDLLVRRTRELSSADTVTIVDTLGGTSVISATTDPGVAVGRTVDFAELSAGAGRTATLPVAGPQHVQGALVVASHADDREWDPDELQRLASMADLAAVALEFAHQQHQQRLLDVFADRERIARDLHDNVIQRLFATGMSLQSVLGTAQGRTSEVLTRAVEQLDRTVREIRTTIFDLQSAESTAPAGLRRRLLDVIGELTADVSPSVQFSGPIDTLASDSIASHAEAVLREGLSNARRHAGATSITVTVSAGDDFTVTVADDGVGMSGTEPRSGLTNLSKRAAACGGRFDVDSAPDSGTTLTWRVPLGTRRSDQAIGGSVTT